MLSKFNISQKIGFSLKVLTSLVLYSSFLLAQNLLNNPESVVFDEPRDRYIVSNWGDGTIVVINRDSTQNYFSTEFLNRFQIAGLYIYGDTLLCAAGNGTDAGLLALNIATAELLFRVPIPEIGLPNDIVVDNEDNIYITDYWGDRLYKISNHIPSEMIIPGVLGNPNGMLYDEPNNRLLIISVSGSGAPVLAVSLIDSSVSTIISTGFVGTDGITQDADGNYYISEWTNDRIYKYDHNFSVPAEIFSHGNDDPADIYYDTINNIIAIPNFSSNTVRFVPVNPVSVGHSNLKSPAKNFLLNQNYPNPFNPGTSIKYEIKSPGNVSGKIFNESGQEIIELLSGHRDTGEYNMYWNGKNKIGQSVSSGTYFLRLTMNGISRTMKMLLIK